MDPMGLKRGIDTGVQKILTELDKTTKMISDKKEIEHVATISANNDSIIGGLIAQA
jgi:chaperonin GroEL